MYNTKEIESITQRKMISRDNIQSKFPLYEHTIVSGTGKGKVKGKATVKVKGVNLQ